MPRPGRVLRRYRDLRIKRRKCLNDERSGSGVDAVGLTIVAFATMAGRAMITLAPAGGSVWPS